MERSLIQVLQNHAKDARDFPEIRARDELHLAQTKEHAEKIAECLRLCGEKPSAMRAATGTVMGRVEGAMTGMFRDELIKNFLADYAAEHMEIACYKSLIAAATELGRNDVADICREILRDEEAMAAWLEERIPDVTRVVLQRQTTAAAVSD